jgi:hypothetical protein
MRSEIFLIGIILIITGPILLALAFSSCLGTILSGHIFACISDLAYLVIGGTFFVTGIVTAFIGVFSPDPVRSPNFIPPTPATVAGIPGTQITCKKCGRVYDSGQYFCPSCGQRGV